MNVKSPNNISKWLMGLNSAFKWLIEVLVGRGPDFSKLKLQRPSKMNVFSVQ
jgi:hypothetical protein